MKQIVQSLSTGIVEVVDVAEPALSSSRILVRGSCSLISAGTERMLLEFGRAGWLGKARQQPERLRQVMEKIKTDGWGSAIEGVKRKLNEPLPLGYCHVGSVEEVGRDVRGFAIGDRVVSNGPHAEVVAVPPTLAARVPPGVPDEAAAFAVPGAIALQGLRLASPALGETVAVLGLGLLGQLAVQLLRNSGCRVIGIDFNSERRALAERLGAEVTVPPSFAAPVVDAWSHGRGVDAVLVAVASSTAHPLRQAASLCRKGGRIVLVGTARIEFDRTILYKKELSFQVSCSYGPGRYDPTYEGGRDYPFEYVRWTAQRNMEAVLDQLATARLNVAPLISHRFPVEQAEKAYEVVLGAEPSLGILLFYERRSTEPQRTVRLAESTAGWTGATPLLGAIGAGSYATGILLPAFRKAGGTIRSVVARSGMKARHAGRAVAAERISTDPADVLRDPDISGVIVATRHDSHAFYVCEALKVGKHVFCEKPLCMNADELEAIEKVLNERQGDGNPALVMVGFNRRFAPLVQRMKRMLGEMPDSKALILTINAGKLSEDHWIHDHQVGGGRILGEACHFVDLARFLVGAPIAEAHRFALGRSPTRDTVSLQLVFQEGSIATIHYFANGHPGMPKERVEVYSGGVVWILENFRKLRIYGADGTRKSWKQDKGQGACAKAFIEALRHGGPPPIPWDEIAEVHRIVFSLS